MITSDNVRIRGARASHLLKRDGFDAVICRLPENVLLLTGYFPVLGNSFLVATVGADDSLALRLAIPEDDHDLLPHGLAAEVRAYSEESLHHISTTLPSVREPLGRLLKEASLERATVGYEGWPFPAVSAYTQIGVPGPATLALYQELLPDATFRDDSAVLTEIAAVKTEPDIQQIRQPVEVARHGFIVARQVARPGATEADVAAATIAALYPAAYGQPQITRLVEHVHVMAGPRAANAYRAYNLTSNYVIQQGDRVLVQMEIATDGYWAELTRTFFAGDVSDFWSKAHNTCFVAQESALQAIHEGMTGAAADAAAQSVMQQSGFGGFFKHGLGHGIGFQAINHAAPPKLHPVSKDILETGMVSNLEPAVYVAEQGGLRLNDNFVVRYGGAELLSATVPRQLDWLIT